VQSSDDTVFPAANLVNLTGQGSIRLLSDCVFSDFSSFIDYQIPCSEQSKKLAVPVGRTDHAAERI